MEPYSRTLTCSDAIEKLTCSDAIEKVEGNDDLLISILVRLPQKPIFRFRSVSKRWNNTITDPFFLRSYDRLSRNSAELPAAFIQKLLPNDVSRIKNKHSLSQLTIFPVRFEDTRFKQVPKELGVFISSSNGLILCGFQYSCLGFNNEERKSIDTYHILNPITGIFVSLPPPTIKGELFDCPAVGLVCEENTRELVSNYSVIRTAIRRDRVEDNTLLIETYYSNTGTWTKSTLIGNEKFVLNPINPPLVSNGVFHWRTTGENFIVLYDSNKGGKIQMQLINTPYVIGKPRLQCSLTRSFNDGVLWYGCCGLKNITFWKLPKNGHASYWRSSTIPKSEWVFIYKISFNPLVDEITPYKFLQHIILLDEHGIGTSSTRAHCTQSKSFKLEELIPSWKSIAETVILGKAILLYNVESMSFELVCNDRFPITEDGYQYAWYYPYMESFSLSSYALQGDPYC